MARSALELPTKSIARRTILNLAIFVVAIAVFANQFGSLAGSLRTLRHTNLYFLRVAGVLVIVTMLVATAAWLCLGAPKLRFWKTFGVQTASGFVNRLLPAGLGGIGLFVLYFRKAGCKMPVASALVLTNNILGLVGNVLLICGLLAVRPDTRLHIRWPHLTFAALIATGAVLLLVLWAARFGRRRRRVGNLLNRAWTALGIALRPSWRTAGALLANITLSALNAGILSLSAAAVGSAIAWPQALLVMSLGSLVGAAAPTPGGIGGVEAGLVGGLLGAGLPADSALASVLVYRGLTYWLPIIPGIPAFQYVKNHVL